MSSWPAVMDETNLRLRASCNACNESKVRCSQQKPTCARCERNGADCVYGLSRRTHKDAPPISSTPSQRGGRQPRPGRPPRQQPNGDSRTNSSASSNTNSSASASTNSSTSSGTNSHSRSNTTPRFDGFAMPDEPADIPNNNADFLPDYMFSMAPEPDSMLAAQLLDFSSLVTDSTSSTNMPPGPFSTPGFDYANPKPWGLGSLFGANHNIDPIDMGASWTLNGEGECTCHAGVTELLASMRRGGSNHDQRLSLDAQLVKMKQCILASETSMGCAHGREDSEPIHIMAVAMLIGYVIDDFKTLAIESSPRNSAASSMTSSSAAVADMATMGVSERGKKSSMSSRVPTPISTNMSMGGFLEPRLSWGVLELEEDDEMDLRQRLYLLSFRKLERLLSQLTLYLRDLHNAWAGLPDPSRHTAFVIACGYTRLWLEKKAGDVKRLFSVPARDDAMDSALG